MRRRAMAWGYVAASAVLVAASLAAPRTERWPLWERYASSFLDGNGRVVDPQGGDRTTSEGQSYALFFALVANDRERFDRLLNWTTNNLAGGDLGTNLPSWLWGQQQTGPGAGQWKVLDPHSAADSDLWIAYSLCEAGRLWHHPQYLGLGRRMMALIAAEEVVELPGFGAMLLPGESGFHPDANTWLLNPSYLPLPLLSRLAVLDPQGPWAGIASRVPSLLANSARNGFVMDWVSYTIKDGFQPASLPGSSTPAGGSYDAIRVYLWAGLAHPESSGRAQALDAIPGMARYLAAQASPPEHINAAGTVSRDNERGTNERGTNERAGGPVGFSAALLPYLQALSAKAALAVQAERVTAQLDPGTHLYGHPATYYDQNLILFGLGDRQHLFAFGREGELQLSWAKGETLQ